MQSLETVIPKLLAPDQRILLFGESGTGKSTLAMFLAQELDRAGLSCTCLSADPGFPAFGPPGAACLAKWQDNDWQILAFEALCTLDAGRFRLPLVSAVSRLIGPVTKGGILVDAPGLVRGVAGAELLTGLVETAGIDTVLVLAHSKKKIPLINELKTIPARVFLGRAPSQARCPGSRKRARQRTLLWDRHLEQAEEKEIKLDNRLLTGTLPPLTAEKEWRGRQIAFLRKRRTLALGEVTGSKGKTFTVRITGFSETPDQILVRDAYRNEQGRLVTTKPEINSGLTYLPASDISPYPGTGKHTGPHPLVKIGDATATLLNGIFGDPLLHMRLHNRKRSLLFDLGEGNRLAAHLAHQVTDVFISHSHIDHISGFLWLMRSRIGKFPACRLFGPPGLAESIASLMNGILWDRVGDWGPRFTVTELHGRQLVAYSLQAGKTGRDKLKTRSTSGGLILEDQGLKVRAVTLDHAATPVLAYSLEQAPKINVCKKNLAAMNLPTGPWLGELKRKITAGNLGSLVRLPDHNKKKAGDLAEKLLRTSPARKMVYATDLADTPSNRNKLIRLAAGAQLLFCEAAFVEENRRQAERSGHLTARACGEIARAADVGQLVPFHFSRRYEKRPYLVYEEVKTACPGIVKPRLSTC
ncbi:MAG: MBL fold metallo-hydrolase [Thermodesulfobacteriota bacterium]